MKPRVVAVGFVLVLALLAACRKEAPSPDAKLVFLRHGKIEKEMSLAELVARVPAVTVAMNDPYYGKPKRFRALALKAVLDAGFVTTYLGDELVFRAKDGYTVPVGASVATEDGAYLAIEDLDVPGWEPIGPQQAHPGPFYLVWAKPEQQDLEGHPRPWQLAQIEVARFDAVFPHTSPGDVPVDSSTARGYAIFRQQCVRCHAMNREGGRVGPDLNVPQSIVEYRPEAQIRAYIKNPLTFRYGSMPPHPGLTDTDLDGLLAYFRAMKDRKVDAGDAGK